jgi:hypothetical protein
MIMLEISNQHPIGKRNGFLTMVEIQVVLVKQKLPFPHFLPKLDSIFRPNDQ